MRLETLTTLSKKAKSKWKNDYYPNYRKMEVTVVKVRFVDGSAWQAEEELN